MMVPPPPPAALAPGAVVPENPKTTLNNLCAKQKLQLAWQNEAAPAPGEPWVVRLALPMPDGVVLEAEGVAGSRKEAEVFCASNLLQQLQDLNYDTVEEPPSKKAKTAGMEMGEADGEPMTTVDDIVECYGYSMAVARGQLNQYLKKRNLSVDIPVEGMGPGGTSPFMARLDVPPRSSKGETLTATARTAKKMEAVNQVAFRLCVDLCRTGELPAFQTKQQVLEEGLTPCELPLTAELEEKLDVAMESLGVDASQSQEGDLSQLDFDASPWSINSNGEMQVTWEPPEWGHSPWGDEDVTQWGNGDEVTMALELSADLEMRRQRHEYVRAAERRIQLPVAAVLENIMTAIKENPVTLISGSTGCGKTTQVPQLLLEKAIMAGEGTRFNVVCTQPRRIAAITVAERVAQEQCEPVGRSVGYCVRFNQVLPRGYGSVCFMTTGMLLRRMLKHGLKGISHVIVDEVHERDLDTDFLLMLLREFLAKEAGLRVVLMSATMDMEKWAGYFGDGSFAAIEIPGRLFPVEVHYLEEALQMARIPQEVYRNGKVLDEIPMDVIEMLLDYLVETSANHEGGAILVFLPGWETIAAMSQRVAKNPRLSRRTIVHVLHSRVPKEEQQAAFNPAPAHLVKVILSTTIAESSVTISDVVYVVDSCRVKQMVPIQSAGGRLAHRLTTTPASKDSLQQRAGRAGRVREGLCFRLISKQFEVNLPQSMPPEMVRMPLHQVTLLLKSLDLGIAAEFLALAPDPPPVDSVHRAVLDLQDLKALDGEEHITCLGSALAQLPIEPRMGFALLTACLLGLGEPMAALSALTSSPSLYVNETRRAKELCASATPTPSQTLLSDHHEMLMTYYDLTDYTDSALQQKCQRDYINLKAYTQVREATVQTVGILQRMGFKAASCRDWLSLLGTPKQEPEHLLKWSALSMVLAMGLEHFAVRKGLSRKVWVGKGATSQLATSPGIPDVPTADPLRPFFLFAERVESEWSSTCRGVTSAGAAAAALGAARALTYDDERGILLLDNWAPIKVGLPAARRLAAARASLRVCLLSLCGDRLQRQQWEAQVKEFVNLLVDLCHPVALPIA